jgi:hypothetical protein
VAATDSSDRIQVLDALRGIALLALDAPLSAGLHGSSADE